MMPGKTDPNNVRLAELLDLSTATISRIRNGFRQPGPDTMKRIEQLFKWSVADQFSLAKFNSDDHAYSREFNRRFHLWAAQQVSNDNDGQAPSP